MSASVTSIFKNQPSSNKDLRASPNGRSSYPVVTREDRSLVLAEQEKFDVMCLDILWGKEQEDQMGQFGEMLRGLVLTFLPENRYHLHLLKSIAGFTWKLNRVGATQKNLFESLSSEPGKFKLPVGTFAAAEWDASVSQLLSDLEKSISIYQRVRKIR